MIDKILVIQKLSWRFRCGLRNAKEAKTGILPSGKIIFKDGMLYNFLNVDEWTLLLCGWSQWIGGKLPPLRVISTWAYLTAEGVEISWEIYFFFPKDSRWIIFLFIIKKSAKILRELFCFTADKREKLRWFPGWSILRLLKICEASAHNNPRRSAGKCWQLFSL